MLRGIFSTCKTSKNVTSKSQEVILCNQQIIHYKLEIAKPLEEFDETEIELVDIFASLTIKELGYF
jgi:hypothetical protein